MPEPSRDRIVAAARAILARAPAPVRYKTLVDQICADLPEIPRNTVIGTVVSYLPQQAGVLRPGRGLYALDGSASAEDDANLPASRIARGARRSGSPNDGQTSSRPAEAAFYGSFAAWLVEVAEECTGAVELGGNAFGPKWGTPDVVGTWKSRPGDIIQGYLEIVSAEVKVDTAAIIQAFGQACAYKLFSHKTYIVVPRQSSESDRQRIDALAQILGIGLVFFDATNPEAPEFEIRVRPARHEPDIFYVNQAARSLVDSGHAELFG